MRVFVAGAGGALGTQLVCHLLAESHEVIGFTRSAVDMQKSFASWAHPGRSPVTLKIHPAFAPLWIPRGRRRSFTPLQRFPNVGRGVLLI